jgi:hypothetical protein
MEPQFIVMKADAEVSARKPIIEDIKAVERVLNILQEQGKTEIAGAIKAVYFTNSRFPLKKGEIVDRVTAYAVALPASTKSVYAWLKSARLLFAQIRGLSTSDCEY